MGSDLSYQNLKDEMVRHDLVLVDITVRLDRLLHGSRGQESARRGRSC